MKLIDVKRKNYERQYVFDLGREIKDKKHVEVSFYVEEGGMDYYTFKREAKGYYLHITPMTRTEHDGYVTTVTTMFNGLKTKLKEITRKSQKSFNDTIKGLERDKFFMFCKAFDNFTTDEMCFMYDTIKEHEVI